MWTVRLSRFAALGTALAAAAALAVPAAAAPGQLPARFAAPVWFTAAGNLIAVDPVHKRLRLRGCTVDTGWIVDPAMTAGAVARGSVLTKGGTLRYRAALWPGGRGEAVLDGPSAARVEGQVVTRKPPVQPWQRARLEKVRTGLAALTAAKPGVRASLVVRDYGAHGGQRFEVDGADAMPAAGTVGVQVLAELLRQVDCGARSLDEPVPLGEGGPVPVSRLAESMIAGGDQAATGALIDLVGLPAINDLARTTGQEVFALNRKPAANGKENETSAADLATALTVLRDPGLLSQPVRDKAMAWLRGQKVTTKFPASVPTGTTIAHVTGEQDEVSHDAGFLEVSGRELLVAVTTAGGEQVARDELVRQLMRATYDQLVG